MNNFYHKVAFAFACTALSCGLGANKEAKAATFKGGAYPLVTFQVIDGGSSGRDGLGDVVSSISFPELYDFPFGHPSNSFGGVERTTVKETAALVEFAIPYTKASIGYPTDTKITKITNAVFRFQVWHWPQFDYGSRPLGLFGYIGNGTAEASDFEAGVFLDSITFSEEEGEYSSVYFNVTPFLNELVSNNNKFAGFAVRALSDSKTSFSHPDDDFIPLPGLYIEGEYEVVPEPTTIFGSAIGLCLGGWLKRKKSTLQNKAKSQA